MEDVQQFVESFEGNGLTYNVANGIQDMNSKLVSAFVNGHRVEVAPAGAMDASTLVTLVNPGYVIDGDDTVVIVYQG